MNRFMKLGYLIYDYRKIVLIVWAVIVIISGIFAWRLPDVLKGSGFVAEDMEASIGRNLLRDRLDAPVAQLLVLIEAPNGESLSSVKSREEIHKIGENLRTAQHVKQVLEPTRSQFSNDQKIAYMTVGLDLNEDDARVVLPDIRQRIKSNLFHTTLAGDAVFYDDVNHASQEDLKKAEAIGLPVTLLVLLIAFGTWVAAGLPLLVGIMSAGVTLAILYGIGHIQPLSVFVLNTPTMLGIAVGVDYSLLFVSRFREELMTRPVREAVAMTTSTAGRSVFFSGLTVVIGISSMIFWDMMITRSVMIGGMLVVTLTMLTSLTLLPAVLGILGQRINRGKVLRSATDNSTGWYAFARQVMRRPLLNIVMVLAILTVLILPIRNLSFAIPGLEALPATYPSHAAMQELYDTFGEESFTPIVITLQDKQGTILEKKSYEALQRYVDFLKQQSHVQKVDGLISLAESLPHSSQLSTEQQVQLLKNPTDQKLKEARDHLVQGDTTQVIVTLDVKSGSREAQQVVKHLRAEKPVEFQTWVGGATAAEIDFNTKILSKVPHALLYAFIVTYVLLFLAFQSAILPLKALIMNSLSIVAAFGVLVLVYDSINTILPVFVFAFVFGTSMDYEVFMLSRIQEEYQKSGDNAEATAKGLAVTSRLITSAALILVLLTGSFIFTDVLPVKQIGLGLAVAVFLDATLIRLFLVPSLMKLLGDWNWWAPKWTRRWKIRI